MQLHEPNPTMGNWNQPMGQGGDLPGATASMVLGIIALVFATLINCCYLIGSFPALVLSIIGLVLGSKATRVYDSDPGQYSLKSLKFAKAGKIMNLIALILSILFLILFVILIAIGIGMSEFNEYRNFD